jgi:hypothetical protein
MAVSDSKLISLPSGSTFAEADLYKAVGVSATGGAVLYSAALGATGGAGVVGTLYGVTSTTNAGQAVEIGVGPIVKAFVAGSTEAAGSIVTWSTDDAHLVVGTTNEPYGIIVSGSSGTTGRIVSVKVF